MFIFLLFRFLGILGVEIQAKVINSNAKIYRKGPDEETNTKEENVLQGRKISNQYSRYNKSPKVCFFQYVGI